MKFEEFQKMEQEYQGNWPRLIEAVKENKLTEVWEITNRMDGLLDQMLEALPDLDEVTYNGKRWDDRKTLIFKMRMEAELKQRKINIGRIIARCGYDLLNSGQYLEMEE